MIFFFFIALAVSLALWGAAGRGDRHSWWRSTLRGWSLVAVVVAALVLHDMLGG